jgi:hypothetical protein
MASANIEEIRFFLGDIAGFDFIEWPKDDYLKLLRARYEVQRVRILFWGKITGMSQVGYEPRHPDLENPAILAQVNAILDRVRELMCDFEALKREFGVEKIKSLKMMFGSKKPPLLMFKEIFPSIFQKTMAPGTVGRSHLTIRDETKFDLLLAKLRGLVNDLEAAIPGSSSSIETAIKSEIGTSQNVKQLELFRRATRDHSVISKAADTRLDELANPSTTVKATSSTPVPASSSLLLPTAALNRLSVTSAISSVGPQAAQQEKYEKDLQEFLATKEENSLIVVIAGPYSFMSKVTARCFWTSQKIDETVVIRSIQVQPPQHSTLGSYWYLMKS